MNAEARHIPVASRRRMLMRVLFALDAVMLLLAMWLAAVLRFGTLFPEVSWIERFNEVFYPQLFPLLLVIWLVTFSLNHLYDYPSLFWGSGEFSRIANSVTTGLVVLILATFALRLYGISRAWMLLAWSLAFVFVCLGRLGFRRLIRHLRRVGYLQSRTLIVGDNEEARDLLRRVVNRKESGLVAVGFAGEGAAALRDQGVSWVGPISNVRQAVQNYGAETLVIASSALSHGQIARVLESIRDLPLDIHISSGLFEILTPRVFVKEMGGIPMTTVRGISLTPGKLRTKRAFDFVATSFILVAAGPFLTTIALIVKLSSPGPVLFKQERVGRGGKPFMMYKFRSMQVDCDQSVHRELATAQIAMGVPDVVDEAKDTYKTQDDPRITPIGRWIRKFSIDEMPQLLNVMKGEMSLVGPRPALPYEVEMYEDWMMRRLDAVPGMTGLWQVSGRANLPYNEMVKLDIYYLRNWSLRFDLSIMLRTIPAVLFPRGAY